MSYKFTNNKFEDNKPVYSEIKPSLTNNLPLDNEEGKETVELQKRHYGTRDASQILDRSFVELTNAAVISMRMDEKTKQPMVGFAPFSPFGTSKDVKIRTDKVTMTYTPKTDIANAYQQTLGSGLIKPTGPLPNLKR